MRSMRTASLLIMWWCWDWSLAALKLRTAGLMCQSTAGVRELHMNSNKYWGYSNTRAVFNLRSIWGSFKGWKQKVSGGNVWSSPLLLKEQWKEQLWSFVVEFISSSLTFTQWNSFFLFVFASWIPALMCKLKYLWQRIGIEKYLIINMTTSRNDSEFVCRDCQLPPSLLACTHIWLHKSHMPTRWVGVIRSASY